MKTRILIAEDERDLIVTLRDRLTREGYAVAAVSDGREALELACAESFGLILLDVMLPGASGFDVCRELRERGVDTPIVMLTARSQVTDRVIGLKLGGDDYLTKPFEMAELLARIEVQLRRRGAGREINRGVFRFGEVVVDLGRAEAIREGVSIPLSAKEFQLLGYFLEHRDVVLSRDELLTAVWGYDAAPNTRTVDVHVAALRRKVEPNPRHPSYILTVHGLGYRFAG